MSNIALRIYLRGGAKETLAKLAEEGKTGTFEIKTDQKAGLDYIQLIQYGNGSLGIVEPAVKRIPHKLVAYVTYLHDITDQGTFRNEGVYQRGRTVLTISGDTQGYGESSYSVQKAFVQGPSFATVKALYEDVRCGAFKPTKDYGPPQPFILGKGADDRDS
ncbi:MAG TPA: hypothetical protein VLA04_00715 [Verrucomicrobiae bacterium]|nr:hypothetical protein [Verrucomicrobiae bacterium]